MLTEKQLLTRASKPKPKSGTLEYKLWYYARTKLGLGANQTTKKTEDITAYNREYMRHRRTNEKRKKLLGF